MAGPVFYDRIKETTTTTGSGDFTLGGAMASFRAFSTAGSSGTYCFYTAFGGTEWETGLGMIKSTTALERTNVYSSSQSNVKVNFSAGIKPIFLDEPAATMSMSPPLPGGRLTLTTQTPVVNSDVAGVSNVYYTPYIHNWLWLWDGYIWVPLEMSEPSYTLSALTSGKNYDVFAYKSGSLPALEVTAWNTDTARTTDITLTDGRYTKSGDKTRLYLGTFRTTGTTTTEDSFAKRFLFNAYNQVARPMKVVESTSSWTYSTDSWQQARNTSANQLDFVSGFNWTKVTAKACGKCSISVGSQYGSVGIGLDSTSVNSASIFVGRLATLNTLFGEPTAEYEGFPGLGRHTLVWLERATGATMTWYGANTSFGQVQTGIIGSILM